MLESPILYLKVMRILMFQLSGFYCNGSVCGPSGYGYRKSSQVSAALHALETERIHAGT